MYIMLSTSAFFHRGLLTIPIYSLLVLAPLLVTSDRLLQDASNATTNSVCPAFRYLDTLYPNTPIYGAPNGCRCLEGLEGINCGFCNDDASCQLETSDLNCRSGFRYAQEDTNKGYQCRLANTYETLFPNGKASFYFDLVQRYVNVSVFNTRNVNSFHLMDCALEDCDFDANGAKCATAQCECTQSGQCADWFIEMIDNMNGQPADIVVRDPAQDESLVEILVGDQIIESNCKASVCTKADPTTVGLDAVSESNDEAGSSLASTSGSGPIGAGWFRMWIGVAASLVIVKAF